MYNSIKVLDIHGHYSAPATNGGAAVALMLASNTPLKDDPRKDIVRKLKVNPEWFLIAEMDGKPVGVLMAGYEGRRGWINSFAVDPTHRKHGIGRALMAEAERLLRAAGCPKINLQVRLDNEEVVEFYRRLGYEVEPLICMGKRLTQD